MNVDLIFSFVKRYWKPLIILLGAIVLSIGIYIIVQKVKENAFNSGVATQKQIAADAVKEGQAAKAILEDTLKELAKAKEELETEKRKREEAERIFYDSGKTFAEKLKEYERVKNNPLPITHNGDDIRSLCERAKQHGIFLDICPK